MTFPRLFHDSTAVPKFARIANMCGPRTKKTSNGATGPKVSASVVMRRVRFLDPTSKKRFLDTHGVPQPAWHIYIQNLFRRPACPDSCTSVACFPSEEKQRERSPTVPTITPSHLWVKTSMRLLDQQKTSNSLVLV